MLTKTKNPLRTIVFRLRLESPWQTRGSSVRFPSLPPTIIGYMVECLTWGHAFLSNASVAGLDAIGGGEAAVAEHS